MGLLIITIATLIIINIYVSFRVFRCGFLGGFQQVAQTIIIWLIPMIGAIIIFSFVSSYNKSSPFKTPNDAQGHDSMPGEVQ